jgi:hypothetical protein
VALTVDFCWSSFCAECATASGSGTLARDDNAQVTAIIVASLELRRLTLGL